VAKEKRAESAGRHFCFYEYLYRDYTYQKKILGIVPDKAVKDHVYKVGKKLSSTKPKANGEISFSDLIYDIKPVLNGNKSLSYEYVPMLNTKNSRAALDEHIRRFNKFDINKLPLIDVANYLSIKVEKSKVLNGKDGGLLGQYRSSENKIILSSDYKPTFLHELAHAVDSMLPGKICEKHFEELVAEYSAAVLCKEYNIRINASASLEYLDGYSSSEIDIGKVVERVAMIYEFVKRCREEIQNAAGNA